MVNEPGFRILGVDPGTHRVGFGLVRSENGRCGVEDYGCLCVDSKSPLPVRLKQIHQAVAGLLERVKPDVVAVEEVYVSKNAKTTLYLGHARGVILLAAVERGIPVVEYAPREIKKAVVGQGGASKHQIQCMIARLFRITEAIDEDAADGLAVALCHGLRCRPGY